MSSVPRANFWCRLSLALLAGSFLQAGVLPAANAEGEVHKAYISSSPTLVHFAGEEVFSIRTPAGLFSPEERKLIVERNLNNALKATPDRRPEAVEIEIVNHLPVIRLGGKHIVTVDELMARDYGVPMLDLANQFAGNLRRVLSDSARIETYVAQMDGDFLSDPYTPPSLREQWQAARKNHAASTYRKDLPTDMISSGSLKDQGFKALANRDPLAAQQLFRASLRENPENERALYGMGLALLKSGYPQRALMCLEAARGLDPNDAEVHIAMGQCLEALGQDREAMDSYKTASALTPENPEPLLYVADMREDRDQIGTSVRELGVVYGRNSEYVRLKRKDQLNWRLRKTY